jgi:hypothetical protein
MEAQELYIALCPQLQDPFAAEFANYLRYQSNIRMPKSVPKLAPYIDDLQLLTVEREPRQDAEVNRCWFNCLSYTQNNPGSEIVFGWQISHVHHNREKFALVAYHHAVIRENNRVVDITPYAQNNDEPVILFVPDSRVPYDYDGLRTPLAFFWSLQPMLQPFWTVEIEYPHKDKAPEYGVGKPNKSVALPPR